LITKKIANDPSEPPDVRKRAREFLGECLHKKENEKEEK
jgi:hypothetical protein